MLLLPLLLHLVASARAADDLFVKWFDPQTAEILDEATRLVVNGTIPSWIKGKLIRVGPTVWEKGGVQYSNYLDSFGRVSSYDLSGETNQVTFMSAIIRSLVWNHSTGSIAHHITQEKTLPASYGLFNLSDMDNTDVNVYHFKGADTFLTFTDFHLMNEIDLRTLRTIGSAQFGAQDDSPEGAFFSSSHPGEYVHSTGVYLINWLGVKTARGSTLSVYAMGADMVRRVVGSVDLDFLPYSIHSTQLVGDYLAVVVAPVFIEFLRTGINLCLTCSTQDDLRQEDTFVYVFALGGVGQVLEQLEVPGPLVRVRVPSGEGFFTFHHINGWLQSAETGAEGGATRVEKAEGAEGTEGADGKCGAGETVCTGAATVMVLDVCAYTSMDGILGQNVLGNFADVRDVGTRDSMACFCDSIKRITFPMPTISIPVPTAGAGGAGDNGGTGDTGDVGAGAGGGRYEQVQGVRAVQEVALLSNVDLPLQDALGNRYRAELLTVSPNFRGAHHCTVYGVAHHAYGGRYEDIAILKVDSCRAEQVAAGLLPADTPTVDLWYQEGVYPGEPVFVAQAGATEDDRGVLMVVTRRNDTTSLVLLDARTLGVEASVDAPFPLMFEFHGQFFPDEGWVPNYSIMMKCRPLKSENIELVLFSVGYGETRW